LIVAGIRCSIHNRLLVLLLTLGLAGWGLHALWQTPVDAYRTSPMFSAG
jgi:Cu(I)/Ag(I) efflux system membrane protein CusA/SilA